MLKSLDKAELARYVINGLLATAVHYSVLTFNLQILGMASAGVANFIAAAFGITASFLGSRYFVFRKFEDSLGSQMLGFGALYTFIAVLHGFVLWFWSDMMGLDYRLGFLIATVLQVLLSYLGNKVLVFKT